MKIFLLINVKRPLLLAFSYLLEEKISCSAEHEKHFIPSGPDKFGISFVSVHGVSSTGEWVVCSTCKIMFHNSVSRQDAVFS